MKVSRIGLVFIILIAMCFPAMAYTWSQAGYNVLNSGKNPTNLGSYNYSLISQTIPNQGTDYFPLSVDLNGDGNDELITYDSGSIRIWSFNSSMNQFQVVSSVIQNGLISGLTYDPIPSAVYAYSSSTFYVFHVSSTLIYLANSIALGNSITPTTIKGSPGCVPNLFNTTCILKEDGSAYDLITIQPSTSISIISKTSPNLADGNFFSNYKVAFLPVQNFYVGLLTCNESGRYGLMAVNLSDGGLYQKNCTLSSYKIVGNPKVYQDANTGDYYAMFQNDGGGNPLQSQFLTMAPSFTLGSFGIGGILGSEGGVLYDNNRWYWSRTELYKMNSSSVVVSHNETMNPLGVTDDAITQTGDFVLGWGSMVSKKSVSSLESMQGVYLSGGTYPIVTIASENGLPYVMESGPDIRIHAPIVPPLSYPNITLAFRNSVSNLTLGALSFFMYDSAGNPSIYGDVGQDGTIYLGNSLTNGTYNVTANVVGFLPINQQINITKGTITYYIYGVVNSSIPSTINLVIYDSTTGINIMNNVRAILIPQNGTTQEQNSTSASFQFLVPSGNYSISLYDNTLTYQSAVVPMFYHAGVTNIEQGMTKVPFISQSSPRVYSMVPFIYIDVNDANGFKTSVKNYNFGNQLCINQTMWVNVTSVKSDAESYGILDRCGNEPENYTNPLAIFDQFIPYAFIPSYFVCQYDAPGTYQVQAFAQSASFPNNYSNFAVLLNGGMAQQFNVVVNNKTCDTFKGTLQQNVSAGNGNTDTGQFHLMIGVIIWIIASIAVGAFISALIVGGAVVFGVTAGIVGIGTAIIMALPFVGWFPPYITLILTIFDAAAIAISIRGMMQG